MKWFHEAPTTHTGMKSANISVLGVYIYVNKDMQMYVDIHVLETVTVFSFSSVWEAVIEIISFHGEEQHTYFVLPEKTRGLVLSRKCYESRLLAMWWLR